MIARVDGPPSRARKFTTKVGENMQRSQEHPVIMYLLRRARRLHYNDDVGFCLSLNRFKEMIYSGEIPTYPH